jgi:hypothetical protein
MLQHLPFGVAAVWLLYAVHATSRFAAYSATLLSHLVLSGTLLHC